MAVRKRHDARIARCESVLGYRWKQEILCAEALNMAADVKVFYNVDGTLQRVKQNDRLAAYGGSVAASHLCRGQDIKGEDKRKSTCVLR
ncbi:hypothetical protein E4U21_000558 [Claviceps maximensis]|nr:hypothetical protein E4U21_000558 [Claviceps maximensis]